MPKNLDCSSKNEQILLYANTKKDLASLTPKLPAWMHPLAQEIA